MDKIPPGLFLTGLNCALGCPALDPALHLCITRAELSGRITSLDLLAMLFLMQPRRLLAFLAARAHFWLVVNMLVEKSSRSFSAELRSSQMAPRLYWSLGLFMPRCRTSYFHLLNFTRFFSSHFFSLLRWSV